MGRTGVMLVLVAASVATLAAFQPTLDPASLADAIVLGQTTSDSTRANFHAPYRVNVGVAPVDDIEVVTPFRRIVLDAETQARAGNRGSYGQRVALATLGDDPSRVDIVVELTFSPLNNYVGVPGFVVTLVPQNGDPISARTIRSLARFGPKLGGSTLVYPYATGTPQVRGKEPLSGGMVIAKFDGKANEPNGGYVVMVTGRVGEPAKARVDFSKLR